jgi:hypothetical protein
MDINEKLVSLAQLRKSDEVIVYITSDKRPLELFSTQIALDIIPIFDKHLYKLGRKKKISLFLSSSGGSLDTPWPLVSLIREYCDIFETIIPSQALSAGTLICLGADKIVMTPLSSLSPVDPQGNFQDGKGVRQIQVEDVTGFVNFAKNKVGISEQNALAEIMKILSNEIPPSILGSINRTHSLIRLLSDGLLKMHKKKLEKSQTKQIIENLTEKLFSHQHLIGRNEAKHEVGFKNTVDYATYKEEKIIRECFDYYKNELQLEKQFNPAELIQTEATKTVTIKRALIQSSAGEDAFMTDYIIQKTPDPGSPKPFAIRVENQRWTEIQKSNLSAGKQVKEAQKDASARPKEK